MLRPSGDHCGSAMVKSPFTISVAFLVATSSTHSRPMRNSRSKSCGSSFSFVRFSSSGVGSCVAT
jgi:hypothetical protein